MNGKVGFWTGNLVFWDSFFTLFKDVNLLISVRRDLSSILVNFKDIISIIASLKHIFFGRFRLLLDIWVVDSISSYKRFFLGYRLLSVVYNINLNIYCRLSKDSSIISLMMLYSSANWLEREIWDLFGIYFYNHYDLRRLLTDYGFQGHPFLKDFPLGGFTEVRYVEERKRILQEPVKFLQEYRWFNFVSPWEEK